MLPGLNCPSPPVVLPHIKETVKGRSYPGREIKRSAGANLVGYSIPVIVGHAERAPLGDKISAAVELLYPVVSGIRDIYRAVNRDGHARRRVKLAVPGAV